LRPASRLFGIAPREATYATLIATTLFQPHHLTRPEADEFDAAGEIDAVPIEP
jgi:hypothetical protein